MAFIYQISYIYKGKGMQRYMYALVITLVLLAGTSAFCPSAGGEEAITAQEYEIFRQTLTTQRPWSAVNPETMAAVQAGADWQMRRAVLIIAVAFYHPEDVMNEGMYVFLEKQENQWKVERTAKAWDMRLGPTP